jgi:predicted metal-dependent phosphoesterase TrpH
MYRIDLHTHSVASPDGSLGLSDYRALLGNHTLDYIAITDHNRIDFAQQAQAELGRAVIVGEEVTTRGGEIIGLFLKEVVPAGLELQEAAARIKAQGGLVYVPHPFETMRSGVAADGLEKVAHLVDIVEIRNGRAVFQNRSQQAEGWARSHAKPGAASSDAHGRTGWGNTYSVVDRVPEAGTLPQLLQAARYSKKTVGIRGLLYPKLNRLRRGIHA